MSTKLNEEVAKIIIETGVVTFSPHKPFIGVSGIRLPLYCDHRILMAFVDQREHVTKAYIDMIQSLQIPCEIIAGVAKGGIPHAAWIAAALRKPMIYVRDKPKDHGKQNLIEGKLEVGQSVLVIEDLISTGGSSVNAVEGVRHSGGKVKHCLAIMTYGLAEATEKFQKIDCRLTTLTDLNTVVRVAREKNLISNSDEILIRKFAANPRGWKA